MILWLPKPIFQTLNCTHGRLTSVNCVIKKWSQTWRKLKVFSCVSFSPLTRAVSWRQWLAFIWRARTRMLSISAMFGFTFRAEVSGFHVYTSVVPNERSWECFENLVFVTSRGWLYKNVANLEARTSQQFQKIKYKTKAEKWEHLENPRYGLIQDVTSKVIFRSYFRTIVRPTDDDWSDDDSEIGWFWNRTMMMILK